MKAEPMEREADRLLLSSARQQGRGDYPFYTQRYIARRARLERILAPVIAENCPPPLAPDEVLDLEVVVSGAGLTPRQAEALRLRLLGVSFRDIGRLLGVSHVRAHQLVQTAVARARRFMEAEEARRAAGLSPAAIRWVFWCYAHRYLYRPPPFIRMIR